MQRKEFFRKLSDVYPKIPTQAGIEEYNKKLSEWKVSAKQLDLLYDRITENCEFFPTIAQLTVVAAEVGLRVSKKAQDSHFLLFDMGGFRTATIIRDPADPPFFKDAGNIHLAIAPGKECGYECVPFSEGILLAREEFFTAGGKAIHWNSIECSLKAKLPPMVDRAEEPTPTIDSKQ